MRLRTAFALFLAAAVTLTAARGARAESNRSELKIGFVLGLTGPAQAWAKFARMGAELALAEANETAAPRVTAVFEDSRSEAAGSVTAYKKLVEMDHIRAVIGDVWGYLTLPLVPLANRDRIAVLSPAVMPENISSPGAYFFTMGQKAASVRAAVNRFFEINPGVKTAAIIYWDDVWGQAYLKEWQAAARERGVKIVFETGVRDFAYDYRTEVAKLALKKPDAVLISHQMERILKNFEELKFKPVMLTTSNVVEVWRDGTLPAAPAEGLYLTDWRPSPEFAERFKARFGEEPLLEAHNAYEAVRAMIKAFAANPEDPAAGFRTVHYSGVGGPIDFRASFAGNGGEAALYRISGGRMVKVP